MCVVCYQPLLHVVEVREVSHFLFPAKLGEGAAQKLLPPSAEFLLAAAQCRLLLLMNSLREMY